MKTGTLFLILTCITLALCAADDKMINLQSNDGTCIPIARSVAKHAQTLANLIDDCPVEQAIQLHNFNTQELKLLVDVLNTIHQATPNQDALTLLHAMINSDSEHALAALHDFFDIHILRQALAQHFFHAFGLNKTKNILQKAAVLHKVCENLWANSNDEKAYEKTPQNAELIHRVIENIKLTDKKNFLISQGKNVGLFFTGVSIGEGAQYGLINMNYRPADTLALFETDGIKDDNVSEKRLLRVLHFDVHITGDYITSLENFAPTAPIDITDRIRSIWIYKTNIRHLPADSFQHGQDPERLLIHHNKIASLDNNAFRGLKSLTELNLSTNNLTFLPPKIFKPLVNLKELSLSDNKLAHIHADMFKHCTKLKTIHLLDTLIPLDEINVLRATLPNAKIYTSFNQLVASNYSLINS